MTTAHPLEIVFLIVALIALAESFYLFTLKLSDLLKVKRERQNGPMLFMTMDNLRRQGFSLTVCGGMVILAVSGINSPSEITAQTKTLLTAGVLFALAMIIEGAFIYRRRKKLAVLVALYEGMAQAGGGRRITDR